MTVTRKPRALRVRLRWTRLCFTAHIPVLIRRDMRMSRRLPFVTLAAIAVMAVSCSRDPQKLKANYIASGDKYVAAKSYSEALIEYRKAVAIDSTDGPARLKLGVTYQMLGDYRNALNEYVRAAD